MLTSVFIKNWWSRSYFDVDAILTSELTIGSKQFFYIDLPFFKYGKLLETYDTELPILEQIKWFQISFNRILSDAAKSMHIFIV